MPGVGMYVNWMASYQMERTDLINIGGGLGLFMELSVLSWITGLKNFFLRNRARQPQLKDKDFAR